MENVHKPVKLLVAFGSIAEIGLLTVLIGFCNYLCLFMCFKFNAL